MDQQFDPLYQFRWPVPDGGFEIVDGVPDAPENAVSVEDLLESPWAGATSPASTTHKPRARRKHKTQPVRRLVSRDDGVPASVTSPLVSETGLFREFASMHPAKESKVLDFANRHGSLFEPFAGSGEDVSAWFHEIETMHHLMLLWDAIDHKLDALASIIHWDHNTREVEYRGPLAPGPQIIASAYDIHPAGTGIASRFRPGDLVGPARHVFRIKLNEQLERYPAASRLLFKDNRYDSLLLCIVPGSLISALWLQFARAVQEGKTHRQCEQCGRWFEVMPEKLEGGKYCRNACRTKAYRLRIEEARKLRAAGMSVKKIAEKLGSDEKTVKGWTRK